MELSFGKRSVELKNLDKIYFKERGTGKAEIIEYYIKMWKYIEQHLKNRPFSMIFFPSGSVEDSFYQKQRPNDAPKWVKTVRVGSKKRGAIDWICVNDLATMIYLVNKSAIEAHCWFSRFNEKEGEISLRKPDIAAIDLDPNGNTGIKEAAIIAQCYKEILDDYGLESLPKTSGGRGIHIFISIKPQYDFEQVQLFLKSISSIVEQRLPTICTRERLKSKRKDRVYLDCVQCNYAKTLAMPYSLRAKGAGLVSAPLKWSEVDLSLDPRQINIQSIFKRMEKVGDLCEDFYKNKQDLPLLN